jgi:hypothetical protein
MVKKEKVVNVASAASATPGVNTIPTADVKNPEPTAVHDASTTVEMEVEPEAEKVFEKV